MKNFKLILASIVVSCFFLTTNVNAQGNSSQVDWGDYSFYCLFAKEGLKEYYNGPKLLNNNYITQI